MMNARGVYRLLNVHGVIDHVGDHVEDGLDYWWPTGTADSEPEAAVFAQHERWRHRRQGALVRSYGVALALDQAVEIRCTRLGGEIIHLVIDNQAGTFCHYRRAVGIIQRVSIRN